MMIFDVLILFVLVLLVVILLFLVLKIRILKQELQSTRVDILQQLSAERDIQFGQFEAYLSLRDRLNLHQGLPYTHTWSAAADFLKLIVEHALQVQPKVVFECSSGLTTLMLARCCQMNGVGHVFSLENGADYAETTRQHIARYELQNQASVIHAPLQKYHLNDVDYDWYSIKDIPDQTIDMLVIDGPPGYIQKHSRYPALPLLLPKLAKGCVIFLDDAARSEEKEIVTRWLHEYKVLKHEYVDTVRGCSILRVG